VSGTVVAEVWGRSVVEARISEYPGKVPKGQRFDKSSGRVPGSRVVRSCSLGDDRLEVSCPICGVMALELADIRRRLRVGGLPAVITVEPNVVQ
jgi:hypothetical protein